MQANSMRIDKWLWAARLFKTRALAQEQLENQRVQVNTQFAKPSRELRVGDSVAVNCKTQHIELKVVALSAQRGPASVAKLLYEETAQSIEARQLRDQAAKAQWAQQGGAAQRPTKADRRERDAFEAGAGQQAAWNDRWSAVSSG